jgi:hypothetical protein
MLEQRVCVHQVIYVKIGFAEILGVMIQPHCASLPENKKEHDYYIITAKAGQAVSETGI